MGIEWVVGIAVVAALAGLGIGLVLPFGRSAQKARIEELEGALQASETELGEYRNEVYGQFAQTAEKFKALDDSYQALHRQLATSAVALCGDQANPLLIGSESNALVTEVPVEGVSDAAGDPAESNASDTADAAAGDNAADTTDASDNEKQSAAPAEDAAVSAVETEGLAEAESVPAHVAAAQEAAAKEDADPAPAESPATGAANDDTRADADANADADAEPTKAATGEALAAKVETVDLEIPIVTDAVADDDAAEKSDTLKRSA